MRRRRLSERQIARIERIQERRRHRLEARTEAVLDGLDEASPRPGRIMVRHGANLAVEDDHGHLHHCVSRRNIGQPVCGDRVVWQTTGDGTGVVTALLPRATVLSRPDYAGRDKPLAANVTLMIIVVAPRPAPTGYLIDQYLVTAELIGVDALILCNKMDLLDAAGSQGFLADLAHYADIGYALLPLSVKQDPRVRTLLDRLAGETAILLGQSGVGKSSLVKALLPDQDIQIGRLSQATGLGRHTTSASTCYRLGEGGYLIDSPGVRSFRLGTLERDALERGFREFAPYLGRCRFADCRHLQEPDCALREAAAAGAIAAQRLENFHLLAAELERTA
jgi:ribosome biogenesis GTPase